MAFQMIENRNQWDDFVSRQEFSQFLQSWSWGEFQKAFGRRVWRVGLFENGQMVGAGQIIEHYLGLGMGYLYCPRGPIFRFQISDFRFQIEELIDFLKKRASAYGELFLRVEPVQNIQYLPTAVGIPTFVGTISNIQYFRVPSIQPSHVLLLDLSQSEETLLTAMHPKTRYNIRLAERKGLASDNVILSEAKRSEESFSHFWLLLQETAKRDKIRLHPRKYYELMLRNVTCYMLSILLPPKRDAEDGHVTCFKNLLAAGLFIGFGDTFAYVHGASSSQHREMMASHLLHWQAIKFAKSMGYRYYDFGGVNPENNQDFDYRNSWVGLTRFKKGFASGASPDRSVGSGHIINYPGTFDVVLNKWGYRLYESARKVIRLIRNFSPS